jgi:phage shock protein B
MVGIGILELIIIGVIVIPVVAIMGLFLVAGLAVLKGGGKSRRGNPDEARLIQEIHRGLEKMEKRIESLETIVLDQTKDHEKER